MKCQNKRNSRLFDEKNSKKRIKIDFVRMTVYNNGGGV